MEGKVETSLKKDLRSVERRRGAERDGEAQRK